MLKNILIAITISVVLMLLFYLVDRIPTDNGGNLITFSFLLICCTYFIFILSLIFGCLAIFKSYINPFWTIFILTFIVVSSIVVILAPVYSSFNAFLVSKYTILNLVSFVIALAILLFRYKLFIKV